MKISLKFVPKGPINNIPAFLQIMAIWTDDGIVYSRIYALLNGITVSGLYPIVSGECWLLLSCSLLSCSLQLPEYNTVDEYERCHAGTRWLM